MTEHIEPCSGRPRGGRSTPWRALRTALLSAWLLIGITASAQVTITIAGNPGTSGNVPLGFTNYHVGEHIYLASEIGQDLTINRIQFNMTTLGGSTAVNTFNNVTLYLRTTPAATLTAGAYSTAGYTQVFTGTMAWTATGFAGVDLTTPFVYSQASGNLQLLVVRTDNAAHGGTIFATANGNSTGASLLTSRRYNGTGAPVDGVTTLTTSSFRTSIRFQFVPPCSGTPTPGNTLSNPASACAGQNITLSLQNATTGQGVSYQWETSPDGSTWSNATGTSTNASYVTTQAGPTYYRCQVTCPGNGTTASNPIQVGQQPANLCYCAASANNGGFERISNVTIGPINNTSSSTAGYEDFTALGAPCFFAGSSYSVSITVAGAYANDDRVYVWIDTDQNGVFADPGELYFQENVSAFCPACAGATPATLTGTVTIPGAVSTGITGMRVRLQDNFSAPANTTPCGVSAFGQVEDYRVNLQPVPTCLPTSGLTATAQSNTSASLSWTDGNAPTPAQWQIEYGPEGFTPGTGSTTVATSNPFVLTGLSSAVNRYEFYVYPDCGGGFVVPVCSPAKGRIVLNDVCAGAISVAMGPVATPVAGNSANGTMTTPSCSAGAGATTDADVWFTFTATSSFGTITVTPAGGAPAYYPTIELLTGTSCSLLSQVCCTFAGGAGQTLTVQKGLTPGQQYWMRIGHAFAGGSGNNQFTVAVVESTPPVGPCTFSGTPAQTEVEACSAGDNSSCLLAEALPLPGTLPVPYLLAGNVYAECNLRDLDYYTFTLTAERNLQFGLTAQFGSQLTLYNTGAGCPGTQIGATTTAAACASANITQLLQPGTYTVLVTTNAIFNNIPCGSNLTNYQLLITELPIPTGACCQLDGTCSDLTASQCAAVFGNYGGNGTQCISTTCPPPPTCGGTFTDSGGGANPYAANENRVTQICSNDPINTQTVVTFSAFDVESGFDALYVYDGPTPASPLIASANPATSTGFPAGGWYGTTAPGPFTSTHPSGCLSFRFRSDASVQNAGWTAGVTCVPPPSCASPTVVVGATTGTTAQISWNCLNCTPNFYVEYGAPGFTPGIDNNAGGGTLVTAASSPTTLTGLVPGTTYQVYVRHDCAGSTYSANSAAVTFTTPPSCGNTYVDNGGVGGPYAALTDETTVICATTPLDIVTVTFSLFDVESTWDALYVYDGPNTTFPLISSGNPGTNSGFPAGGFYGNALPGPFTSTDFSGCLTFRFRADDVIQNAGWSAAITCTPPPPCRVPSGVATSAITTTGATVSWNCSGCTGTYILEYGPTGFSPGTDNTPGFGGTVIVGATSPTAIAGLTPNTSYDVYVRQDCNGSGNGYGANSVVSGFSTLIDCSTAPVLDCFVPNTFTLNGLGQWNIVQCGQPTPGKERVYQFTAPFAGAYTLEVTAATGGTVDYFFKAAGACSSTGWTCITEFATPGSAVIILPTAGSYYILADAEVTSACTQTFRMICPSTNVDCATALPVACGATVFGNTSGAPTNLPVTACAFNGGGSTGGTNWWVHTATSAQEVTVTTCGQASFNTRISVFRAAPDCNNLVCVASNDDNAGCPSGNSELFFASVAGETYYVVIHGSGPASGLYSMSMFCNALCAPATANDQCANATVLPAALNGTGTFLTGDNTCALLEGPTSCSGTLPVQGVWYTFNSGANSNFVLTLAGNAADPLYSSTSVSYVLYNGGCTSLGATGEISCTVNGIGSSPLGLSPGVNYTVLVYNQGGLGTEGTFGIKLERPGVNDASISAVLDPVGSLCSDQFEALVRLKNKGEATLTSATISLSIDANPVLTYAWTGSLATGDSVDVLLPIVTTPTGVHILTASSSLPNGQADEIPSNDAASATYNADGQTIKVTINTDNKGAETSWQLFDQAFSPFFFSGGPYANNTSVTETLCLPTTFGNTWFFYVFDSFGDGMCCANGNGSWVLQDRFNRVVLRDNGQFTTQSPSSPPLTSSYSGHEVVLPLGPAQPAVGECEVFDNLLQNKVFVNPVSGVTSYQYEFSNPDAGFRRRIGLSRNFVLFTDMQTNPLSLGTTYFLRVRADQGAVGYSDDNWGPGCEMAWSATAAYCTQLISTAGPTLSCGVTRTFGGSSKIWAQPVPGVVSTPVEPNPYHFRFTGTGSNSGYVRNIFRPNYICPLSWVTNPLVSGQTYDVQVQVWIGGVWKGFCGNTCQVTISNTPPAAGRVDEQMAGEGLELWPNPVRDGRVNLRIDGIAEAEQRITVDVYDVFGKRVFAKSYGNTGSLFNTVLELDGGLATGVYMVNITLNDRTYTKRLSVL